MSNDPTKPYNDLPLLPPRRNIETTPILKATIRANRALAELKGLGNTIPNPWLLLSTIVFSEAKTSSEIENVYTTNDALYRALAVGEEKTDPATKEVLRYREAMRIGFNLLENNGIMMIDTFIELIRILKQDIATIRRHDGIKIVNSADDTVIYTPPTGEKLIREKLGNLVQYMDSDDDVDPLIKLAVIHYQFEAIHPFSDGNGRTGRIINILYLIQKRLLDLPILYLSKGIIEKKQDYYRLLRSVTENGEWEEWILFMLGTIEETSIFTNVRIKQICSLINDTAEKVKIELPSKVYSKDLIELLFQYPFCKIVHVMDKLGVSRPTATDYLNSLVDIGILELMKFGRENFYMNLKLLGLLSR